MNLLHVIWILPWHHSDIHILIGISIDGRLIWGLDDMFFSLQYGIHSLYWYKDTQGLSQDLETGCPKLALERFLGVLIFKGTDNMLRLQP